jgi:hypothetical protein
MISHSDFRSIIRHYNALQDIDVLPIPFRGPIPFRRPVPYPDSVPFRGRIPYPDSVLRSRSGSIRFASHVWDNREANCSSS